VHSDSDSGFFADVYGNNANSDDDDDDDDAPRQRLISMYAEQRGESWSSSEE
jgi:hypothetical protein